MKIEVEFLSKEIIEHKAGELLESYEHKSGPLRWPPVPVDEIAETYLDLDLDFDDLSAILRMDDVLGATWVQKHQIIIDETLDPSAHPRNEGRYHFTLAHEIGHWELHRHLVVEDPAQSSLFFHERPAPTIVTRRTHSGDPAETQADAFAAALLMPRHLVLEVWKRKLKGTDPIVYEENKYHRLARYPRRRGVMRVGEALAKMSEPPETHLFRNVARPFAGLFRVSVQAMQFRLQSLGLLLTHRPPELFEWGGT